jgi:energy-coupling factor transporter ATP-binding protein EcfA2
MGYKSYLKPRPEVISDEGIEGIIDIANLKDESKTKIEARPESFFKLTYPTTDIIKVIEQIDLRFSSTKRTSGLFLFEGLKGSGKSHLLLLIYNLFKHKENSAQWLKGNGLKCRVPDDAVVIINKFTDDPSDAIWDMIFENLGVKPKKSNTHPKLPEFQKALGDRKIILIFDELEQGIKVIGDEALKAQNLAFLQMLSEFSNRSKQVTLFASIYTDREEPGSTLKRGPRCVVQFDNTRDQNNIILHRLFENFKEFDKKTISPCVESYVQLWQKHVPSFDMEECKGRFLDTYPFSPSLVKIILTRVPARGGFQNVRGALSFLGNMVRLTHSTNDIITPGDASLEDKANTVMLKDLDPSGDLINRARENLEELKSRVPLSQKLASTVLLYTLTERGSSRGVSREELIIDLLSPTENINDIEQTLMGFQKYASYFHHHEGRYYFDLEENAEAKVEFKSLSYSDQQAQERLYDILKSEIFRETASMTVFTSVEQTQEVLKHLDKPRPRYVLTGRRLTQEERHQIYWEMDYRNLILLLEPKDDNFQLAADKDLLKWAKRCLAARDLAESTTKSPRREEYERILRTDQCASSASMRHKRPFFSL